MTAAMPRTFDKDGRAVDPEEEGLAFVTVCQRFPHQLDLLESYPFGH
jgi:hypothetical protein